MVTPFKSHPLTSRDPPIVAGMVTPFKSHPLTSRDPPMVAGRVTPFKSHPLTSRDPPIVAGKFLILFPESHSVIDGYMAFICLPIADKWLFFGKKTSVSFVRPFSQSASGHPFGGCHS